jgi:hypothetical protein
MNVNSNVWMAARQLARLTVMSSRIEQQVDQC